MMPLFNSSVGEILFAPIRRTRRSAFGGAVRATSSCVRSSGGHERVCGGGCPSTWPCWGFSSFNSPFVRFRDFFCVCSTARSASMSRSAMRHWFCALRVRLTSRSDLSLLARTSTKPHMNTTCSAAAWRARTSARTAAARGSVSISSGKGRSFARNYI